MDLFEQGKKSWILFMVLVFTLADISIAEHVYVNFAETSDCLYITLPVWIGIKFGIF